MRRGLAGSIVLALGIAGLVFAQAVRTGGGGCSAGSNCSVNTLTATKTTAGGVILSGDAGLYFGDGTAMNTASTAGITSLTGDVTGTGPGATAATVALVGTSTAANVHAAELLANAATNANTVSTIVKRDSSGNFSAGTVTAALTGNVAGNLVSSATTDTAAVTIPGETLLCMNSACTNFVETDGGTATVNMITGVYRKAQVLDNSSNNAAFVTNGVIPAGTGVGTAAVEKWYSGTGLLLGVYAGGVVANWSQMNGNASSSMNVDTITAASTTLVLKGNRDDNVAAVALALGNASAYTTTGSQSISFRNGSAASTEYGYVNPNGLSSLYTQHPVTGSGKRTGEYTINLNSDSTFTATKLPSPSLETAGVVASAPTADGTLNMIDYPTLGVNTSAAGIAGPYTTTRFDFRPRFTAVFRTGASVANIRIFLGLAEADLSGVTTLAGLNAHKVVALRYDTGIPDTVLMLVTSDGTTASASACGSISPAANTTYILDLDFSRTGGVICRINNSAIAGSGYVIKTTNLPTGTTDIGIQATETTLAASAKDLYLAKIDLEQN